MKRLPLFVTVLAVVLLSASLAYWGLQLFKPQQRAIAAPPAPPAMALNIDAAKGLFGGQIAVAAVSNYQLKGVVAARGEDSAAILSVDNKPAEAVAVGKEVVPGVLVKEVYPRYVLLSEGGVIKRVDLPSDAGISSGPPAMPGQQQQQMPPQQPVQPIQPQPSPPAPPPPSQPPPQSQRSSVAPMTIAPIPSTDRQ
ncbi:type II secretion system protein N [Duganella sp. CT11-72]|jgi:general secretion pathway protein C|uniref:type II secretion system protein N n=1 Tax=Duganella sp. CT11-72 TaxID=3243052 RepID=UPI0039AFE50B